MGGAEFLDKDDIDDLVCLKFSAGTHELLWSKQIELSEGRSSYKYRIKGSTNGNVLVGLFTSASAIQITGESLNPEKDYNGIHLIKFDLSADSFSHQFVPVYGSLYVNAIELSDKDLYFTGYSREKGTMGGVEFNKNTFNEIITGRINLDDGFKWVDSFSKTTNQNNEQGTSLVFLSNDEKIIVGCKGGNGNYYTRGYEITYDLVGNIISSANTSNVEKMILDSDGNSISLNRYIYEDDRTPSIQIIRKPTASPALRIWYLKTRSTRYLDLVISITVLILKVLLQLIQGIFGLREILSKWERH